MKPRRILTPVETTTIIDAAVRDSALAVVSLCDDSGWRTVKSRFLERDPNRRFFVLEGGENIEAGAALALGQYVGVSFRLKSRKVMFATVVEARGKFLVNPTASIAAIRFRWPDSLTELQRRAYFRTPIPGGVTLRSSVWFGGVNGRQAAQAAPFGVIPGEAADISCGGMLIRVGRPEMPQWNEDQTVGVEIHVPDGREPLVVDAFYRGIRTDESGNAGLAVQFVGLETTDEGRAALQRLARCVQRFHRLTMSDDLRLASPRPTPIQLPQ
jgi:c-di-GMP-binding flagellar brake protein YcgR